MDVAFERETRCLSSDTPIVGAAFADVDPREPGAEAVVVAEDGSIIVIQLTPWPVADDLVPASAGFESHRVREQVVGSLAGLRAFAPWRFVDWGQAATDEVDATLQSGLVCAGRSGRIIAVICALDGATAP
jgi:hypothetical protein